MLVPGLRLELGPGLSLGIAAGDRSPVRWGNGRSILRNDRGTDAGSSERGIELPKARGRFFGQQRVEIYFLDAVRLAALFDDGKNLDMPVEIFLDGAPVGGQLALRMNRVWSGLQHQVIRLRNLRQAAQSSSK